MKLTKKFWRNAALVTICIIAIPAIIFSANKANASVAIDKKIAEYGILKGDIVDINKLGYDFKNGGYSRIITTKRDMAKWKAYLENPKHKEENYYYGADENDELIRKKKNTTDPKDTDWYYIFTYDQGVVTVDMSVFGNWIDPDGTELEEYRALMSYPKPN
ncbi:hypothetical protein HB943_05870 [Listeria weihenstephanensis]|uniref:Uncharacterized protein n=1 Tax=Listeria weihenstephanensis TaxID=1006155 RepID=A0A841Z6Z1_9LIST|nr:hypothetical protein [Listeria weihenstephanensis]MBC1500126.1 hypothetical protein [Listeria weihenstephanensis]